MATKNQKRTYAKRPKKNQAVKQAEGVCLCGCGGTPRGSKSRFLPGHDAKLRSMAIQLRDGKIKISDIPAVGREYVKSLNL